MRDAPARFFFLPLCVCLCVCSFLFAMCGGGKVRETHARMNSQTAEGFPCWVFGWLVSIVQGME